MSQIVKRLVILVIVLAVIVVGLQIWARIYPDWLWFGSESINLSSVFWTILSTKVSLGIIFGFTFLALTLGNLFLVWRFVLRKTSAENVIPIGDSQINLGRRLIIGVIILVCVFFGIIAGLFSVSQWETYLRFSNSDQLSFAQIDPGSYQDPIFGKDIAYYVFKMPFLRFVRGWLFLTFLFLTLGTGVLTHCLGETRLEEGPSSISHRLCELICLLYAV